MNIIENLSKQPILTVRDLTDFERGDPRSTTEIEGLIAQIEELCGNFFSPETTLIRHDAFSPHFAADFAAWAEEEGDYASGKELMDAEAAYLDWLRPLCAELSIGGVSFYLNHKLHLPEDWFFRRSAWQ